MLCVLTSLFASAPSAPVIIPEECSAENNSVTVAWQPPPTSYVEGYVLELDDGNGGEFRVSSLTFPYLLYILKRWNLYRSTSTYWVICVLENAYI